MKVYKEMLIEDLIKILNEEAKKGSKKIQLEGTLMIQESGNMVILSTEDQM